MKNFLALALLYFMRFTLWFRYRVTVKGLDQINPIKWAVKRAGLSDSAI